jgi:hypothetical protein
MQKHVNAEHKGAGKMPHNCDDILKDLGVPTMIVHPECKVHPIPSILIIKGFMCNFPGCVFTGKEKSQSYKTMQRNAIDPSIPPKSFQAVSRSFTLAMRAFRLGQYMAAISWHP